MREIVEYVDFMESAAASAPVGVTRMRRRAGVLQQSVDGGLYGDLRTSTGYINAGTNGTTLVASMNAASATGGQTIEMGKGTYRITSQLLANANGISLVGNGPGSTFLEIDDAGGMGGTDAILVNSVLRFALKGMTIVATTPRTAGSFLKVKGQNNITATPAQTTRQYTIEDVDAEDQFNGVVLNNGDDGDGAWGGFINRCEWIRFSAGGTYVDVNSSNGGQHYISNLKMYGSHSLADGARALAGVRYRGGADLELANVNQIYMRNGLLLDPSTAGANVVVATGCLWDNNTQASIKVAPSGSGSVEGVEINGGWGYTPAVNTQPTVQVTGGRSINFYGGKYWGCYQAFNIAGPVSDLSIVGADASGSAAGFYFNNNAADFQLIGNICNIRGGVTPTVGIQVDAGCDHYAIIGNNTREAATPLTNTPGTSAGRREVVGNITV